ncbi:MAG: MerR family transcriptional regulator [Anaerolineales bacterium]
MSYTVKQLSKLAGVSVRTLHYYDEIELLKPDAIRTNGYREYGEEAVLKLQQIMFYRELDFSLEEIKALVSHPGFDSVAALERHRMSLQGQARRLERLIQTVDNTILHTKGLKEMSQKQMFEAFSEDDQEKYAREAEKIYDPAIVKESNRRFKSLSTAEKLLIFDEGNQIYADMGAAITKGADSPEVQAIVERWRKYIDHFWTPNIEQLKGLAEIYNSDTRFKTNFDRIDPRLAEFMREAVRIYLKK